MGNEEVSAVSQAWFTTKEDKDSLTNKGRIFQMQFSHAVKRCKLFQMFQNVSQVAWSNLWSGFFSEDIQEDWF